MKNSKFKNQIAVIHRGFTLTELLVVVLIIAILATLAILGTQRVKAMADKATSIRNISQLQIANVSYAAENNGKCVPLKVNDEKGNPSRWFQNVMFLTSLTGKPAEEVEKSPLTAIPLGMLDPKVVRAKKTTYDRVYTSYGMNDTGLSLAADPGLISGHNLNQVSDPSRSMAFATATDFRITYNSRYKWDFKNPKDEKTGGGEIAYRHGDKVLVVYFDGHVGEMGKADLELIDKSDGKNHAFWKPKK